MRFLNKLVLVLVAVFVSSQAGAATWYVFNKILTEKNMYYFDRDTVVKTSTSTTIWIKSVSDLAQEMPDGVYSSAIKYIFHCNARIVQSLTFVSYDKAGKFIRSFNELNKAEEVIPGSIGEDTLKTVCMPVFPNSKSREAYSPMGDADIFKYTKDYFDYKRSITDPTPQ